MFLIDTLKYVSFDASDLRQKKPLQIKGNMLNKNCIELVSVFKIKIVWLWHVMEGNTYDTYFQNGNIRKEKHFHHPVEVKAAHLVLKAGNTLDWEWAVILWWKQNFIKHK